jgi:predicted Zn-dependent protease with MMP-like domain
MTRAQFRQLVEEALRRLPKRFASRLQNVAIVVEDYPPERAQGKPEGAGASEDGGLLMGVFEGTPATEKSVWDSVSGPDRVVLYQRNIEAVCDTEGDIREEIRLTLLHEIGHYFGMTEEQLEDV